MKKLSIKEKAKRYDEAITDGTPVEDAIFPELKESEDEKVRKTLIDYFKNYKTQEDIGIKTFFGIPTDDIIAWLEKVGEIVDYYEDKLDKCACDYFNKGYKKALEKQGEQEETLCDKCRKEQPSHSCQDITALGRCALEMQGEKKPADKVELKFKDGDYIVYRDYVWKVFNISLEKYYELLKINNEISTRSIEDVDNNAHLWTIQDAKDGDILFAKGSYFKEYIFIYSGMTEDNVMSTYCGFDMAHNNFDTKLSRFGRMEDFEAVFPATKEQCDLLFQKMKEAGYEWDAEKKELKKIEQNTNDKVEPFDKYEGLTDFERTLADICIGWIGDELGWKQYIKDNADVLLKIAIKKFNSVEDAHFEQKPAWSEEDEHWRQKAIDFMKHPDLIKATPTLVKDTTDWLKSLKERVQPQTKQEWSEEDEKCIKNILWYLNGNALGVDYMDRCKNWLEHIKDRVQHQSHWKPSDEQMKALTFACIKNVGIDKSSIKALYDLKEQLKQL